MSNNYEDLNLTVGNVVWINNTIFQNEEISEPYCSMEKVTVKSINEKSQQFTIWEDSGLNEYNFHEIDIDKTIIMEGENAINDIRMTMSSNEMKILLRHYTTDFSINKTWLNNHGVKCYSIIHWGDMDNFENIHITYDPNDSELFGKVIVDKNSRQTKK